MLSDIFINNVHSAIIHSAPKQKSFSNELYRLMSAFDNNPGQAIIKAAILDGRNDAIAEFTAIPNKKRRFIIGAWPWQEDCQKFINDLGQAQHYRNEILGEDIYYRAFKTSLEISEGSAIAVRAISLQKDSQGGPLMILITNIPDENKSAREVVEEYLLRWPNLPQESAGSPVPAQSEEASERPALESYQAEPHIDLPKDISGIGGFWSNIHAFLLGLNNYCQRHFFPAKYASIGFPEMQERFYGLSGYLKETEKTLIIELAPPDTGHQLLDDLKYAIQRLNEGDIRDNLERKVVLRLPIA